ncbi:SDR family oxidoreductase [Phenylobacterium sp.]|jgi:glucose 1-dehydrogenase|uniref:SDR family oxidoreductase n=1 Tax=Phenylobacterium sp. TaxID=1871053 RepID=UPI002E379E7C|nr:SDR family oxidoreductase [Phenylobacterium sp.]HEX3367638.1 SDR family oxidoreductase [Phenylobacterium sp.]
MTDQPLTGQRVLITGASSGIGAGMALGFAEAGAAVVVNHFNQADGADSVIRQILGNGGQAIAAPGDVSNPDDVAGMFDIAAEHFGGIDILVANAGIQKDAAFTEMSLADWRAALDVDLTGAFLCAQAAVRRFRRQGLNPARSRALGKVLFTSSVHQTIPWAGHANYAAAKGGVKMLMETMAQELAPEKIRVNAIAPGAIQTPINKAAWDTPLAKESLLKLIPYGRIGEPQDVAAAAVWLASDAADYVVGATLFVDGGMTLYPCFARGG